MSDKLPACRLLPESPFAGSLDKLEACRTLRGALFILSERRDRHEGSCEMILSFRPVRQSLAPQRDHRIYSCCSPRRDVTGQQRHSRQQQKKMSDVRCQMSERELCRHSSTDI
jgi:hypothetical protein